MKIKWFIFAVVFSLGLVFIVYLLGTYPMTLSHHEALLRLALRFQNNKERTCRPYTEQEMRSIPVHMRQGEKCEVTYYPYVLELEIDGQIVLESKLKTGGHQSDRPLVFMKDIKVSEGDHQVDIVLRPEQSAMTMKTYSLSRKLSVVSGQIHILKFDESNLSLTLTSS